jgi:hypothetical protein
MLAAQTIELVTRRLDARLYQAGGALREGRHQLSGVRQKRSACVGNAKNRSKAAVHNRSNSRYLAQARRTQLGRRLWPTRQRLHATLLPQTQRSWYLGVSVRGKPRVFMPYAGGMARYQGLRADAAGKGLRGRQTEQVQVVGLQGNEER